MRDRSRAVNFLRDVVQSGDTISYEIHAAEILPIPGYGPDDEGVEYAFTAKDGGIDISHALADALSGEVFNHGKVIARKLPEGRIASFNDGRTLTIMLGEMLGLPAHKHFDFKIIRSE